MKKHRKKIDLPQSDKSDAYNDDIKSLVKKYQLSHPDLCSTGLSITMIERALLSSDNSQYFQLPDHIYNILKSRIIKLPQVINYKEPIKKKKKKLKRRVNVHYHYHYYQNEDAPKRPRTINHDNDLDRLPLYH